MLTIRQEQMDALLAQRRLSMVVTHAHKFFPEQCAQLRPEELQQTAQSAMKRAASYGLTPMRDVLQFLDLVMVLGADFDSRLPWAREILEDRSGTGSRFRSTRLYLRAVRHLRSQK
jgi:hypothetical protein